MARKKIVSKKNMKGVGKWAFVVGLVIAVLAAFLTGYATIVALVLFLLGLLVGFLNISERDNNKFLLGAVALLIGGIASLNAVSIFGGLSTYLGAILTILTNFIAFVGAAALVVAIKVIFETGRD